MDKTYFTQKWMNAREEYDMCSRSSILDYYLRENDNLEKIIDIGSGTGSFLRWLIVKKYKFEKMLMIDQDEKLLNKVYKITRGLSIDKNLLLKKASSNLFHLDSPNQNILSEIRIMKGDISKLFRYIYKYNFISFSAIADILPKLFLDKLFSVQLDNKTILFSICYDGKVSWNIKNKYDKYIIKKFNEHQQSVKNDNYTLGPASISYIKKKAKQKLYKVKIMDSPWKLNSDNVSTRDFHQQYINTIYKALQKDKNTDTLILKEWTHDKSEKNKNIVITEKKLSFLTELGNKLKADIIEHKNYIGGRYSVLSEVGMLPAELLGLNEKKFKRLNYLIKNKYFINQLIYNVNFIFDCVSNGKKNSVILNYDESSNNLFKWYQQLTAESLGKKNKGIFPIISSMPKDNHSLLQLYLDGPKNNFFTFFGILNEKTIKLSNKNLFDKFSILKNKNLNQIIKAQRQATQKVFKRKKIPFRSFEILRRNEETVGELFTFFVLETILLGRLMEVNPFDQPSVELIKTETSKLLI
jgi:glucose-6-phosphate isomerase